ncbi:hypothetical protein B0H67DRAFT_594406 [Lasiosphaeris hirsuta]|uniref:Uncharacterized protein n=1 Tax=Lasiosphaeris hirsuta TaxID=260670 RepID=A0AA39ZXS3_9PEZI|nr:hypothetical protein B0H67DRAFT_594406 [Lasiosphaeris hirsuta]
MDFSSSQPGSPAGGSPTPLQPMSHNQQSLKRSHVEDARDASVHDKISQFNSLAMQSKHLERKTADAALKRAMLGREEAESDMRRYRDEVKILKKQIEEGKERERRVGERLETVMENYGRSKETHSHTQAIWEKEIRRARKETFKAQSAIVKLQEELKSCRMAQKSAEDELEREKGRSKVREQEAFTARYTLVGIQEQLDQALERVKMLEQERDAFKTLAQNEADVARIAAEGKLPLPPSEADPDEEDEFASPRKRARVSSCVGIIDINASEASEAEIEELSRLWRWEKQRADRALEQVDFLQAECHLMCCPAAKSIRSKRVSIGSFASPRRKRSNPVNIADAGDLVILSESAIPQSPGTAEPSPKRSKTEILREEGRERGARHSTIFMPSEGIFRTITQTEAEILQTSQALKAVEVIEVVEVNKKSVQETTIPVEAVPLEVATVDPTPSTASVPPTPADAMPEVFARTPSLDPPDFAVLRQQRTSLLSLLDAPHKEEDGPTVTFNIPTTPGPDVAQGQTWASAERESDIQRDEEDSSDNTPTPTQSVVTEPLPTISTNSQPTPSSKSIFQDAPIIRPHTSAACYVATTTVTTTTKVPLREETKDPSLASRLMKAQRTPMRHGHRDCASPPSFDVNNPALTPTMTREQALAQIKERRGRARSVGRVQSQVVQPVVTPRRQMVDKERREVSAPTARMGFGAVTGGVASARRVRS